MRFHAKYPLFDSQSDREFTFSYAILFNTISYYLSVYTKTVDSVEGALWLASQTPNILCYLPPSNSGKNGVPVCIRDKRRNHLN